ncbi:TPA: MSCRAMM family adhesin clumping factor ClfA, partial [Staphylococcus aureus]|nr:MSCRAMM family adhesin clumping factor ClfA [Staphylococcus aureus]HDB5600104.1 MSCRAMM family adhesin clumping factor ClfA [Staphylococcus aureus]
MNMKKKEKHAIRKKSIGVASVLVGTLIGFGLLSSKEADASENSVTQSDSASNESKSNDSSSVSAAPKTDDTNVSDTKTSSNTNNGETSVAQNPAQQETTQSSSTNATTEETPVTGEATTTTTNQANTPATTQSSNTNAEELVNQTSNETTSNDTNTVSSVNSPQNSTNAENVSTTQDTSTEATPSNNESAPQSTDASNKDVVNQAVNTSAPRMRAFSLAAVAADAPAAGTDITNQLTNVTVGIDSGDTVYPHQAGYVKLNYGFSVPNSAVKGDTFKITVPKELNLNGVTSTAKVPPIMAGDQVLANGVIDSDGNVIYTFTDYVNTKDDVKATLTMPAYIDPENVTKTGNVTLATGIGNTTANKTVLVDYEKYGKFYNLSIKGTIDQIDKTNNTYRQTIYVNPSGDNVIAPVLTGNLKPNTDSNALIDQQNTSIKVYKVDNAADLSESYFVNPENFEDVTNSVNITFPNPNQYKVEFNTPDDQITTPYIVVVNGHIDPNSKGDLALRSTLYGYDSRFVWRSMSWDNEVAFNNGSGSGDGIDKPVVPEQPDEPGEIEPIPEDSDSDPGSDSGSDSNSDSGSDSGSDSTSDSGS